MDPITAIDLAHDRIHDLQRTADQVRQERALRPTQAAEPVVRPIEPAEVRGSPATAGGPSPVEPAT